MSAGNGLGEVPHVIIRLNPNGELQFQTNITDAAQVNFILDKAKLYVLSASAAPKTIVQPVAMMPRTGFDPTKKADA
jgi:hypothetical protein